MTTESELNTAKTNSTNIIESEIEKGLTLIELQNRILKMMLEEKSEITTKMNNEFKKNDPQRKQK